MGKAQDGLFDQTVERGLLCFFPLRRPARHPPRTRKAVQADRRRPALPDPAEGSQGTNPPEAEEKCLAGAQRGRRRAAPGRPRIGRRGEVKWPEKSEWRNRPTGSSFRRRGSSAAFAKGTSVISTTRTWTS